MRRYPGAGSEFCGSGSGLILSGFVGKNLSYLVTWRFPREIGTCFVLGGCFGGENLLFYRQVKKYSMKVTRLESSDFSCYEMKVITL